MPPRETATGAEELLSLAGRLRGCRWVDLSHALEPGIPAYPTHARFGRVLFEDYSLPLEDLAGRAATVATPDLAPTGTLTADDIEEWEAEHGNIEPRDKVLIRYGWGRRWATGLEREVSLVGRDTLSVDASASEENPAHYALLGNEVYIVENLNNLDRLPPFYLFVAFPLKVRGGTGSPIRAVALVPAEG